MANANIDYTDVEAVKALCRQLNRQCPANDQCVVVRYPGRPNYNITFGSRLQRDTSIICEIIQLD